MEAQRSDELHGSASGASTSVRAPNVEVRAPDGADTAPALPTASAAPDQSDQNVRLPRLVTGPSSSFASGLPEMSLPSMSNGSYARLYASAGPEENRRAALCYFPPVALFSLFNRRVGLYRRFHAAQALALALVALALVFAHWFTFGLADSVQSLAMVFVEIGLTWLFAFVCAALTGLWLWGIAAALSGKDTALPLVGQLAERILAQTVSRLKA